ncbi:hypothetical protein [Sunxiuqinia elliptica]|uniref:Uncharacterized protein n=1 Tax=Sunxiuqinia elliptica TaxID=655355 RepID=A0A1I2EGM3_9BACT|nr:hypothetical protein [Sunxiuqinia elliptica]SFE91706.1 hypothetical protein SAMN05216283_10284 [Sunxiuqinia elliptica]
MRSLKKRIENMNLYLSSKSYSGKGKSTIKGTDRPMSSGKMTNTLDGTKSTRTSDKLRTSI